jgi:hypothetical protein
MQRNVQFNNVVGTRTISNRDTPTSSNNSQYGYSSVTSTGSPLFRPINNAGQARRDNNYYPSKQDKADWQAETYMNQEQRGYPLQSEVQTNRGQFPRQNFYTQRNQGGRRLRLKTIRKSHKKEKKFDAVFEYPNGRTKVVPFGQKGYSDFTKHKNVTRRARYLNRHSGMGEHWNKPDTPGALSRWILWNKPTLDGSVKDFKKRFHV